MKVWVLTRRSNFEKYSNQRFLEEGKKMKMNVELMCPQEFELIVTKEGKKSILHQGKVESMPDVLIPRMGASTTYFALAVIRHLEKLGVYVLNTSESIEKAKDKLASLQILATENLPFPKTMLAKLPLNSEMVEKEFGFPVVLKTISGMQGKGVMLCENKENLEDIINLLGKSRNGNLNLIFQEYIAASRGKDLRVFVVGGKALGAMQRTAPEGKFKTNFSAGGSVESFTLLPEVEWLAIESAKLLNLEIAGVDILFDESGYKVCEINSSPGFEGFEYATKINIPEEIYHFLQVRLQGEMS